MENIKLFISYARDDSEYFKDFTLKLKKAVTNTEHFQWEIWDDRNIHVGSYWDEEIQKNIHGCNVALLLLSLSFMASNYIKEHEFEAFKKRYAENGILIVPIVLAPCDFDRWIDLAKIQFFKPQGSEYGRSDKKNDFTYADLVIFNKVDGTLIPNPEADRYVLTLAKKMEIAFRDFLQQQERTKVDEQVMANIPLADSANNLIEFPKSRSYFTGRDGELQEFKRFVDDGANFITIDGPGGIGKTQFASRCIEKFIVPEKIIWYVCTPASHLDTLISEAGYPELLKGSSKTDREKFSAFKDKIQKNELFLFLDNFQETNNNPIFREFLLFIQDYLKKGCVVVIDRDDIRNAELKPRRIHVQGFKEKKLEYAKALIAHNYRDDIRIEDSELENLCKLLHGYPLIIDLAILLLSQGETSSDIIAKIVQQEGNEKISERLLNAIFSRPDALPEEQEFITQFSVFIGRVYEQDVRFIIPESIVNIARRRLQQKNLLSYSEGYYEVHPIVREFCYKRLEKEERAITSHSKVADYYISLRADHLSPILEEKIFYHLSQSSQWERIDSEIESNGKKFILQGQLGLVKELLDRLISIGIHKPIFSILYGDIARIRSEWDEAKINYDIARRNTVDTKIRIQGTINYGRILFNMGEVTEARKLFLEALALTENGFMKEKAHAMGGLSGTDHRLGNNKIALERLNESLNLYRILEDKEGIASSLAGIGELIHPTEKFDSSFTYFTEALQIFTSINDKVGIASSFQSIGNAFFHKENYKDAIKNYETSLRISETIGDRQGIATSLGSIGNIYLETNQYDLALAKYDEGMKIAEEIRHKQLIGVFLNNIAQVRSRQNLKADAIRFYEKSLELKKNIHDFFGIGTTCQNLGDIYAEISPTNYPLAIFYFFKAAAIYHKIGRKSRLIPILSSIINVHGKIGSDIFISLAKQAYEKLDPNLKEHFPYKNLLSDTKKDILPRVGRNDPCPCGSGKKYKQCHGKNV